MVKCGTVALYAGSCVRWRSDVVSMKTEVARRCVMSTTESECEKTKGAAAEEKEREETETSLRVSVPRVMRRRGKARQGRVDGSSS